MKARLSDASRERKQYKNMINKTDKRIRLKKKIRMKIKIICHSCDGTGIFEETKFPTGEKVDVRCPECRGKSYVLMETPLTVPQSPTKEEKE